MQNPDLLIDRSNLKKQIAKWKILSIGILLVSAVLFAELIFDGKNSTIALERPFIARISVEGFVGENEKRETALKEALESPNIKALIVRIDTPGGSVVGGEETFYKLREIAKEKPVVAVMRGMATSAGYMIAVGSDYIVAREGTLTGSIGVIIQTAEFTQLAEKIGVTPISIKSSPLKASPGMFEKNTPEAEAALQEVVNDTYKMFVEMVAKRRGFNEEQARTVSDGRVYTGRQALALNLVDELGGEEAAIKWLTEKKGVNANLEVSDIDKKRKKLSEIEDFIGSSARRFLGLSERTSNLDGMLSIWHPSL